MGKFLSICHMKNKYEGDFQANLVQNKVGSHYEDEYVLANEKLGEGITSSVVKVISKLDSRQYAMKSINISRFDKQQLKELEREIEFVKNLDHPNIIKLNKVFRSDSKSIHIIMDLLTGGELISRFPKNGSQVARIASQLLSACKYWHSKNIVHRDLKPENIMYTTEHPDSDIQVIDFGLSTWYAIQQTKAPESVDSRPRKESSKIESTSTPKRPESKKKVTFGGNVSVTGIDSPMKKTRNSKIRRIMLSQVGSYFYMAPELFNGKGYNHKVDTWAIGVIIYLMITRKWPFMANSGADIGKLVQAPPAYDSPNWKKMPPEALDLVKNLLKVNPEERYTADQALKCKWIKDYERNLKRRRKRAGEAEDFNLESQVIESLKKFRTYTKLKQAALMVIAHKASSEKISKLRQVFHQMDIHKTGTITFDDLRIALKRHNIEGDDVNTLFKELDLDKSGQIRYMEFLAATIETQKHITSQERVLAFDHLDVDGTGYITAKNLRALLGSQYSKDEVDEIIRESDLTKDGVVSKQEFMKIMTSNQDKLLKETIDEATSSPTNISKQGITNVGFESKKADDYEQHPNQPVVVT